MTNLRDLRSSEYVARKFVSQEKRLTNLETKPGLAQSSIENGSVDEYTVDGQLASVIGKQHDGTHTVTSTTGPMPPTPWFPAASAVPGIVEIRWNGKFAGGLVSPMDLKHVAAYVVPVGEVLDLTVQAGVMTGELGDAVQVQVSEGVYNVYLVSWSLAGRFSDAAGPVPVLVPAAADVDAIQGALDDLDAKYDGVVVDAGTLGTRLDTAETYLGAHETRLNTAETDIDAALAGDVDVDRLVIGTGVIRQLVAEHIAAKTATFQTVDVKNLFATTGTMSEAVINKLFADVVMSRKITAAMIAVGDFSNLATIDPVRNVNVTIPEWWATVTEGDYTRSRDGTYIMLKDKTDTVPFVADDQLRVEFDALTDGQDAQPIKLRLWTYLSRMNESQVNGPTFTGESFLIGPSEQRYSTALTIGANISADAKSWVIGLIGSGVPNVKVRNVRVYRMNGGKMIIDGSLKARHADLESFAADTGFIADLTARIVRADMFVGKEFHGGMFTGAIFQSPGTGAGFQLTEGGYTSRDENGNVTVRLPADGSTAQFRGDIEARSLTASGRVSFQAPENEIASGAALVLESGVQAPASPPTVGTSYETVQFPRPTERADVSGLAFAAGLWWRGVNVLGGPEGDRIESINAAGEIVATYPVGEDIRNGLTTIGDELFVLGKLHDKPESERWVTVYKIIGSDLTYQRKWLYPPYGTGTYQPGIGVAGSNLIIGQCSAAGELLWRYYRPADGEYLSTAATGYSLKSDVAGIYRGNSDLGVDRVFVAKSSGPTETFAASGAHLEDKSSWYSAGGEGVVGLTFVGGKFRHLTNSSKLVTYSGFTDTAGDTNDWWVAQSWVGPNGEETMGGTPQRFTFMRRSELQMSGGEMPPGVTGAKFYLARKGPKPGRADFHLVAEGTGAKARLEVLPANWATLPTPSATNTFPNTAPGLIKSRTGGFEVRGDGSGAWGPLTFNADGTMSSSAVPAWVPITSFGTGMGPQTFGYVPAYRIWPDGKVELRGVIAGAINGKVTLVNLPAAAKPAQVVEVTCAAARQASYPSGVMRIEVDGTTVYAHPEYGYTGAGWVSLDGIFYYLV